MKLSNFNNWEIKVAVPGENRLVEYKDLNDLALPRYCLHLFRNKDFIEILLTERHADKVLFRKNNNITLSISEFCLKDSSGKPYVNPVWQLLFKSLNSEKKDYHDFIQYLPIMSEQQKHWLANGISMMKPDSEWLIHLRL